MAWRRRRVALFRLRSKPQLLEQDHLTHAPSERLTSPSERRFHSAGLAIALITILAAALRFVVLDQESLWFDTAHSGVVALNPTVREVIMGAASDFQTPLYFVLLHFWLKLSTSDLWLRALTAGMGVALIPLIYLMGRRLFSPQAGLISALFCSVSTYLIYFSRYPRAYILLAALSVAASYALYRALSERRLRWWFLHGLLCSLALYAHAYAYFFVPSLWLMAGTYALARDRKSLLPLCGVAIGVGLSYLPWIGITLGQWNQVQAGADSWIDPVSTDSLKTMYDWLWFMTRGEYGLLADTILKGGRYLFTGLLLMGLWRGRHNPRLLFVAGAAVLPITFAFVFSAAATPLWDPRYFVFTAPFFALWLGAAIANHPFPRQVRRLPTTALLVGLLCVMALPPLISLYADPAFRAMDLRGGIHWAEHRYQEGDLITHVNYQSYLTSLWYAHQNAGDKPSAKSYPVLCIWASLPDDWCRASPYPEKYVNLSAQSFAEAVAGARRLLLIVPYNHNWSGEREKTLDLVANLQGDAFTREETAEFSGVIVAGLIRK